MDRFLGALCALLTLAYASVVIANFNWSLVWVASAALTIGLTVWVLKGIQTIPIGWRAQLLFLRQRMDLELGEGIRWVPFPFGIKLTDCRETILKLDPLKIFTSDSVEVRVDGTIVYRIVGLNQYFSVESSRLWQGLDDIWDEVIRTQVVLIPLSQVLAMHATLGQQAHTVLGGQASTRWGIEIVKVVIAAITPVDQKVSDDLALRTREERQREGQRVEASHIAGLVDLFMNGGTVNGVVTPGGMTRQNAELAAMNVVGKLSQSATENKVTLDSATATILAALLGRRP